MICLLGWWWCRCWLLLLLLLSNVLILRSRFILQMSTFVIRKSRQLFIAALMTKTRQPAKPSQANQAGRQASPRSVSQANKQQQHWGLVYNIRPSICPCTHPSVGAWDTFTSQQQCAGGGNRGKNINIDEFKLTYSIESLTVWHVHTQARAPEQNRRAQTQQQKDNNSSDSVINYSIFIRLKAAGCGSFYGLVHCVVVLWLFFPVYSASGVVGPGLVLCISVVFSELYGHFMV